MDPFADNPSQSGHNVQTLEPLEPHQYGQNVVLSEGMGASQLFHGLRLREVAELAACLQPVSYKQGELILEQGIRHGRLYIIASGQVEVVVGDIRNADDVYAAVLPAFLEASCGRLEYHKPFLLLARLPDATCATIEKL
ncbi:MAG TPA: cyclic nucleotide-binding domain-containing protein [Ktedonobacteraceae bacterium]|nr:cyclic nucleotide-binding domain-containing protein [Ktedonobacteraceae bacterium]